MKDPLVRFGVAMERSLLASLDHMVELQQSTRSKVLSDLARAEVSRVRLEPGVPAFAALTVVYDHRVRGIAERLAELQTQLGDRVRSSLHMLLSQGESMEVIIMQGYSDELQYVAGRVLGFRGVKQSEIVTVPDRGGADDAHHDHAHDHAHAHAHAHDHDHDHGHDHGHGHHHHDHTDLRPRALLAMGASAGLIPCPSALVVLLGAVAQHQIGLGMVLIVAFSAGLAATLTGLGLLVVAAGRVSTRLSGARAGRVLAVLPALSAIAIVAVGVTLTAQAVPKVL
jgi:metal-responsive CopG/Arc/MetJ family transcriptional regulator